MSASHDAAALAMLGELPTVFDVVLAARKPEELSSLTLHDNDATLAQYQTVVEDFVSSLRSRASTNDDVVRDMVVLATRLFISENVTGELSDADLVTFGQICSRFQAPSTAPAALERFVRRLLTRDGEMPSECVRLPALLLACRSLVLLQDRQTHAPLIPRTSVWPLRVFFRHQLCLEHRSHSLFLELAECIDALTTCPVAGNDAATLLEIGHVQNYFHRPENAAESFLKASRISGLALEESVMFGVRTRWQKQQLLQMVLNAKSLTPPEQLSELELRGQPRTVSGEKAGHDLLDRPKQATFDKDGKEEQQSSSTVSNKEATDAPAGGDGSVEPVAMLPLSHLDKAIILALCLNIRNTNPHHGLTTHHIQVYVERVVADPSPCPFIVRSMSLLLRSRIEHGRSRVQQRAFLQRQELVDQFVKDHVHDGDKLNLPDSTFYRSDPRYFFIVAYPTIWALKREFAEVCFEEGLHKTALDLFEQITDWEQIIKCCKELDKRKRAESLARERLVDDPHNPLLWVALGEATREDEHLWKAWELCGHKMAAPMRALAKLALEREQFDKVLEYFDKAVAINPVFGGDWFSLGYASLKLQRLDRCCEAFTRVCQLDPNDAYAWNNLGSVLLRQGKLRPAFSATSQALHNNRRNWRMWQNYFAIGVELKEVTESTLALSTLLEIAQRAVVLEGAAMLKFTDNAIAYMKGELRASDNIVDSDAVSASSAAGKSGIRLSADDGTAVDKDEDESTGLMPLFSDVKDESPSRVAAPTGGNADDARAKQQIIDRYKGRVREVFKTIFNLFVDDADLYLCGARLLGFLEGRDAALTYHQKELRCAKQADQWERKVDLFDRVSQSLLAASALLDVTTTDDATGRIFRLTLKEEVDAALQISADHMADVSANYRKLQVASRNLGKAIAATKA